MGVMAGGNMAEGQYGRKVQRGDSKGAVGSDGMGLTWGWWYVGTVVIIDGEKWP